LSSLAERLQAMGHRVVMIGAMHAGMEAGFPCIHGDHEHGAYLATSHLIEMGHRRIAFASGGSDLRRSLRWMGHWQAILEARRAGIELQDTVIESDDFDRLVEDPSAACTYFRRSESPTGLALWNDRDAMRLLAGLRGAGILVPDDLSIVGYDNLPEGELVAPRLTTVDQALSQQLRIALRLLTQTAPLPANQTILTVPTLVLRDSTARFTRARAGGDAAE